MTEATKPAVAACDHKVGPNYAKAKQKTNYALGWTSYEAATMPCAACDHPLNRKERVIGTVSYGSWQDVPKQSQCLHVAFVILPDTMLYDSSKELWRGQAECKRCLGQWPMQARLGELGPVDWKNVASSEISAAKV